MKEACWHCWHGFLDSALRREAVAEEGIHNSTPCSTFVPQSRAPVSREKEVAGARSDGIKGEELHCSSISIDRLSS
jgi:hypothetical protein